MSGSDAALLAARIFLASSFILPAATHVSNVSGLAASLALKGVPSAAIVAAAVTVAEVVGPALLLLGVAPRLTAGVLMGAVVITTGTLHRFWDMSGGTRTIEQAIFMAQLGIAAALLLYFLSGPGRWSLRAWMRGTETAKHAGRKKSSPQRSRQRSSRPQPGAARPAPSDDELANAA
jgi:putative oxidoreductase